jgi:hypothetical protein
MREEAVIFLKLLLKLDIRIANMKYACNAVKQEIIVPLKFWVAGISLIW